MTSLRNSQFVKSAKMLEKLLKFSYLAGPMGVETTATQFVVKNRQSEKSNVILMVNLCKKCGFDIDAEECDCNSLDN